MLVSNRPGNGIKGKSPVDKLLARVCALSPYVDLAIAGGSACFAFYAVYVMDAPFAGILATISALCFAFLALVAILREMKWLKYLAANAKPELLRNMNRRDFELFLTILFRMTNHSVRSAINEVHRQDDVDWIVTKKKQTFLVQYNHFDEDRISMRHLESLQKASIVFQATGAIVITTGSYSPEILQWGRRKGLNLLATPDLVAMANEILGATPTPDRVAAADGNSATAVTNDQVAPCLVFVDFAGLNCDLSGLIHILEKRPSIRVIASSVPDSTDSVVWLSPLPGLAMAGVVESHPSGRFFAIQKFLDADPERHKLRWVAVDTEPTQFPSGCSELIAINASFGFNQGAMERVASALDLAQGRALA